MKSLKDYHDLYLKWNVLLLANVFETLRNNTLTNYWLCHLDIMYHYLRGPALGWAAMLKMTKVALELIRDPKMCILFEKDTRDGVSYIPNRYSKVSNKYLKSYDSKQELKHIYLIANNLCDYAMSKFLPTNGFK